jgi:hypothetical protein
MVTCSYLWVLFNAVVAIIASTAAFVCPPTQDAPDIAMKLVAQNLLSISNSHFASHSSVRVCHIYKPKSN